tara:strand:+ start:1879 stop:2562 length:684 start_codon:yes stop_codon:yes gene_type:complete
MRINKKKIFIACDTTKIAKVKKIIKNSQTQRLIIGYKFGLEFLNSKNGRKFIKSLKNKKIFLDVKLNDIPNTMKSALLALKDLRPNYLTVHISSGLQALKAVKKVSKKIKIVGVTTLTSLDNKNLKEIGYNKSVKELVKHQAKLAKKAKLDALVCSVHEVKHVKKYFKKEIITPGISFKNANSDQKRITSPYDAFYKYKSDWLVIGRSLTKGNIQKNLNYLISQIKS